MHDIVKDGDVEQPQEAASEWRPAKVSKSLLVVMPGTKPSTPTTRNTVPTARAAFCMGVRMIPAEVLVGGSLVRTV